MGAYSPLSSKATSYPPDLLTSCERSPYSPLSRLRGESRLSSKLLVAQGDDRIDLAGAARRQPHRDEGDDGQHYGDAGEDHRILGGDAEEERGDQPRQPERGGQADDHADERQRHPLA